MSQKNYVGLTSLSTFLDKLKSMFARLVHKHTLSDITDYSVDAALSATSANPVRNSVINAELDAIAEGMQALDAAIDERSKVQMIEDGQSTHVQTLSIQKLTQAEYDQAFNNGTIDVNTIYLTPDEEIDFPVDSVNGKTGDVTLGASDVGAAPTSHAVSSTTYGAGNGSNYGHVKLSDSTSSTSDANSGVAATPKAVKAAYDAATSAQTAAGTAQSTASSAQTTANAAMPKSGGTFTGAISTTTLSTDSTINCGGGFNVNKKSDGTIGSSSLEIYHKSTPYIDFHHGGTTTDYTSRIIENASGTLSINGVKCTSGGTIEANATNTSRSGSTLRNITVLNSSNAAQSTNVIIMVRK